MNIIYTESIKCRKYCGDLSLNTSISPIWAPKISEHTILFHVIKDTVTLVRTGQDALAVPSNKTLIRLCNSSGGTSGNVIFVKAHYYVIATDAIICHHYSLTIKLIVFIQ